MSKAVVHFEILASDVERAKHFYQTVFGWKIERWGEADYWVIYSGRGAYPSGEKIGIDGGLLPRKGAAPFDGAPANAFVCTMEVDDIDGVCHDVEKAGGHIYTPKTELNGLGWNAYCKDTEGNIFGLMQTAK